MHIQSAYIHIPFCNQICHYCDFTKLFYDRALADQYMEALVNEIYSNVTGERNPIKTIYIGGGTPSSLTVQQMEVLFKCLDNVFNLSEVAEFTIEANPGELTDEKMQLYKRYKVNRISLGVQVMHNTMLKKIGRLHQVQDVYDTVNLIRAHNIHNITVDLIYALPNQSVQDFKASLDAVVALDLPHYSTYALQVEPDTVFYAKYKKGKLHRPKQEEEVEMYTILQETMRENGIEQYEISNFGKPGFESKHNLTYWSNQYFYGFGAGASGYVPNKRTSNMKVLAAYIENATRNGHPILHEEAIDYKEMVEEELFLGLRRAIGVDKQAFEVKYGFSLSSLYDAQIKKLVQRKLLTETNETIALTDEGMLLANDAFAEFLLDEADFEPYKQIIKQNMT